MPYPQSKKVNQGPVSFQPAGPWSHESMWSMDHSYVSVSVDSSKNIAPIKVTISDIKALPGIYRSLAEYLIRTGHPGIELVRNERV